MSTWQKRLDSAQPLTVEEREAVRAICVSKGMHDEHLCPVKEDGNPGDIWHRCGVQGVELWIKTMNEPVMRTLVEKMYLYQCKLHYVGHGIYQRYWQPIHVRGKGLMRWAMGTQVMSEDQMMSNTVAFGLFGWRDACEDVHEGIRRRNGFWTNTVKNNEPGTQKLPDPVKKGYLGLLDRAKGFREATGSIKDGDLQELINARAIEVICSPPKVKVYGQTGWYTKVIDLGFGLRKELRLPKYGWQWVGPEPGLDKDPVNRTLIMIFNKLTFETRNAQLARHIYAKKGRVRDSWLHYWIRPYDPKLPYETNMANQSDRQCPFHEFFLPYVDALGKDTLL